MCVCAFFFSFFRFCEVAFFATAAPVPQVHRFAVGCSAFFFFFFVSDRSGAIRVPSFNECLIFSVKAASAPVQYVP